MRLSEREFDELRRRNPDLRIIDDGNKPRPPIPVTGVTDGLTRQFDDLWHRLGGPDLVREFRFHDTRRWRFDYAHLASKVAIEIDGGVWTRGRHTRARGFLADAEKRNTAQALGWRVFVLGTGQVTIPAVQQIIDATKKPGE